MTATTPGIAGFGLPGLGTDNKLNRVLSAALQDRGVTQELSPQAPPIYWGADYFDLNRVSLFKESDDQEQRQILQHLNQGLLQESLSIEQAGVGYMAKMVLMADSIQERMLYSLFAADETTHLAQLQPYVSTSFLGEDPFLQLLADMVESDDKTVLLFVLQVVLEGWGLSHYRRLAQGCHHGPLRDLFQGFLQAEARHHGAGVIVFNQTEISVASREAIVDCLGTFLQMVRLGPQRVVAAIATAKGHLSRPQRIQILQQLDTVAHSHQRLQILKSLIASSGGSIVRQLDAHGLFTPLPPQEAANYG